MKKVLHANESIFQTALPAPQYRSMRVLSQYILMPDGVRLAADIYLPHPLGRDARLPTLLIQTRYWRASELPPVARWLAPRTGESLPALRREKQFYTSHGYAMMVVDVRGTGASFGSWHYAWEPVTVSDARTLVEWIVRQPWSNGLVGGMGISYNGTTAELLLATGHPAVRAVVPMFNHPDSYTDIAFPGGLFNERFVRAWTALDLSLDRNQAPSTFGPTLRWMMPGVRPVEGPEGHKALQAALLEHLNDGHELNRVTEAVFRDAAHPELSYRLDDQATRIYQNALRSSTAAVLGWASWMDAGTGQAALRRLLAYNGLQQAVIGAWSHGGRGTASPYLPEKSPLSPGPALQRGFLLNFFNRHLKPLPEVDQNEPKRLIYSLMGAESWEESTTWPPASVIPQRWFFQEGRQMVPDRPVPAGFDIYTVDERATSGKYSRWWELGVIERRSVNYGDRASQDPFVLAYQTPPLENDTRIAGWPVITLQLDSSEPDCAIYVYLEDVFPDGKIVCISEGMLRSIHRKNQVIDPHLPIPQHSFCQADAWPLVPGQIEEVTFALLPTAALIKRGHRIRVAIAGRDTGNFPAIPVSGTPVWKIQHGGELASSILLPILP